MPFEIIHTQSKFFLRQDYENLLKIRKTYLNPPPQKSS